LYPTARVTPQNPESPPTSALPRKARIAEVSGTKNAIRVVKTT
jgi:hypothetical protein